MIVSWTSNMNSCFTFSIESNFSRKGDLKKKVNSRATKYHLKLKIKNQKRHQNEDQK